jgi:hypothetical protein
MPAFTGTTRTWLSRDGNWNATTSWSGATVPIAGDKVVFSGKNSRHPVISGPSSNIDYYAVVVEDDYPGNFGGQGNFIKFLADTFIWRGKGSCYYKCQGAGIGTTDNLVINTTNRTDGFFLDCHDNNDITQLIISSGKVETSTSADATYLNLAPINPLDAIVKFSGAIALLSMSGGVLENYGIVTNYAVQSGGLWTQYQLNSNFTLTGGIHVMNQPDALTQCWLHGGLLDLNRTQDLKTITTLYKHPNGRINYDPNKHTITFADMLGYETR